MDLQELRDLIDPALKKGAVSPRTLLDRLAVANETTRKTAGYQDPLFTPFYYHLGKHVEPKTLVEMGYGLGLLSSCFLTSCKSVKHFLAFEPASDSFYSPRLATVNVRRFYKGDLDFYCGKATDTAFMDQLCPCEVASVHYESSLDDMRCCLDLLWEHLESDGFIVMDYLSKHPGQEAFDTFCKIVNRKPVFFETRYGTGIVQK